jgi:hypothetical protein
MLKDSVSYLLLHCIIYGAPVIISIFILLQLFEEVIFLAIKYFLFSIPVSQLVVYSLSVYIRPSFYNDFRITATYN